MCDGSDKADQEVALRQHSGRSHTGLCTALALQACGPSSCSSSSCPVCRCCAAPVGPRWATVSPCIPYNHAALLFGVDSLLLPACADRLSLSLDWCVVHRVKGLCCMDVLAQLSGSGLHEGAVLTNLWYGCRFCHTDG